MSLAVVFGLLADLNANDAEGASRLRAALSKVNGVLAKNALPGHTEPESLPPVHSRASIAGFPYSFLHHLRRLAAHVSADPSWKPTPFPESDDPADDPEVADQFALFQSHLLCHSDCEGFYLPIDFPRPLFADEKRVPGGMLGSSQGLLRELVALAPFLGIKLSRGRLLDTEADRINDIGGAVLDRAGRLDLPV
jgi:hypothetical protein